ncbi:MAG: LexA family transcriptional regulator [bacterium]|nr:LexA family transcriptional regulator [bacterium]
MSYQQYKQKIFSFNTRRRRMPSYREIAELCGFASKNAAFELVQKMIEEGVIVKDKQGKILPSETYGEIPVLGLVEAGFPTPAEEELQDTMSLDEYLIENKESSYILRVKGDSMIEAGINEGDMVIAERTSTPKPGQIVIAEVDGAWTMKYLRMRGNKPYLEAANKNYPLIHPEETLNITAVVRAVIRKYT